MKIRNEYNEIEREYLRLFDEESEKFSGWARPMRIRECTYDNLSLWAQVYDPRNPLWRDRVYAADSRWGSIIAPPFYCEGILLSSWLSPIPEGMGFPGFGMMGEDWEFHEPIRVGDEFHLWRKKPTMTDATESGTEKRVFVSRQHDLVLYNQYDRPVVSTRCYLRHSFSEAPEQPPVCPPSPVYTQEQLDYIQGIYNNEVIRGAQTRYWEDVDPGESLPPAALGPTTIWDLALYSVARQDQDLLTMNEQLRDQNRFIGRPFVNEKTNVVGCFMETHLIEGGTHQGAIERNGICRAVTNWMGDDGFIRKFNWRQTRGSCIGNALISRGIVRSKRTENDRHLIDIDAWCEYIDGTICAYADVAVELCSRDNL